MRVAERRHRRTPAAVAVIIAVTLAGCGQDAAAPGGVTSSTRPPRVILPVKLNPDVPDRQGIGMSRRSPVDGN
jgi:type IV pilus biogenesis protein CpaD/CtpE